MKDKYLFRAKRIDEGRTSFTFTITDKPYISGHLPSYVKLARKEDMEKYYRR